MAISDTVCIRSAKYADDRDAPALVVDPVEHAVGAAPRAVAVIQRRSQLLADPVRIVEQGTDDEVVGRERDRFG